jgi:hypothetical protein
MLLGLTMLRRGAQAFHPLGTQAATETIRDVLVQDGHARDGLVQRTAAVMRQMLGEEAALAIKTSSSSLPP